MSEPTQPEVTEPGLLHCYRHPDRETGVTCARCERPICPQCMTPASVGFQCPECVAEGRKSIRPTRTIFGGRAGGNGEITKALIAVNVAIYLITALNAGSLFNPDPSASVYSDFALRPAFVAHGEWWRLLSAMFLHYNLFHIAFNMWALLVMGIPLEAMLGRLRFSVVYLLSGLGGSVLSFALGPTFESAAGASGAIFGLFGAFFIILRRRNLETGGIVGIIVVNLLFSFAFSGIDWRGHVGGLIVGVLIGGAIAYAPTGAMRDRLQGLGAGAIALLLLAAGFAASAHVRHECRTNPDPQVLSSCFQAGFTSTP